MTTTINDLFAALVATEHDEVITVPGLDARSAETLRVNLSSRYTVYRKAMSAVGIPDSEFRECVKFKFDAESGTATVSLGAREQRVSRPISFTVVKTGNGAQQ
jgi:Holliday junction resolvasome RuvABC DNA-binding subunit